MFAGYTERDQVTFIKVNAKDGSVQFINVENIEIIYQDEKTGDAIIKMIGGTRISFDCSAEQMVDNIFALVDTAEHGHTEGEMHS